MLTGKGIVRAGYGSTDLRSKKGKGTVRTGNGNKKFLIPFHPLTNFELCMQKILKLFILTVLDLNMFLKKLRKFIGHKNIKTSIFRIQANPSIMCGYFCIGFIDFMLAGKTLIGFTSLFSPYDFERNDNIILSYSK